MPAPTFGVLPSDADARLTWRDLPFPLAEYAGRLAGVRAAMATRHLW